MALVGIVMGSDSDMPVMAKADDDFDFDDFEDDFDDYGDGNREE